MEVRIPDGTLIQEALAREECAVFYKRYAKNCPSAAVVEQAEAQAKQQRAVYGVIHSLLSRLSGGIGTSSDNFVKLRASRLVEDWLKEDSLTATIG